MKSNKDLFIEIREDEQYKKEEKDLQRMPTEYYIVREGLLSDVLQKTTEANKIKKC